MYGGLQRYAAHIAEQDFSVTPDPGMSLCLCFIFPTTQQQQTD